MHSLPQAPCRAINRDCMSVPQMSSRHAASQVCAIGTRAIAFMTPQRNTIEIMRLFATYHSAHARFTL